MQKGSRWEVVRLGVRRIRDQFADHSDGYRYKLSKCRNAQSTAQEDRGAGQGAVRCAETHLKA